MESNIEEENNNNHWGINLEEKRAFWFAKLIGLFIIIPNLCPKCQKGNISIINNHSFINQILGKCGYYKCRKTFYLRKILYLKAIIKLLQMFYITLQIYTVK